MNKLFKYFKHCRKCDSPVKLTCPDCLVGKQTLIQRGKIWAETFDGITWQIHEMDDGLDMKTIGEIKLIEEDWVAMSNLPKTCIVADFIKNPELKKEYGIE